MVSRGGETSLHGEDAEPVTAFGPCSRAACFGRAPPYARNQSLNIPFGGSVRHADLEPARLFWLPEGFQETARVFGDTHRPPLPAVWRSDGGHGVSVPRPEIGRCPGVVPHRIRRARRTGLRHPNDKEAGSPAEGLSAAAYRIGNLRQKKTKGRRVTGWTSLKPMVPRRLGIWASPRRSVSEGLPPLADRTQLAPP